MACPSMARKSGSSHLFGVGRGEAAQTAFIPELSKALTFFCLTSYPGEMSHSNSVNRELSNDVWTVEVRQRKVALHTTSHLIPIEAWRSAVSTTSEGRSVLSEVRLAARRFGGYAKFEERETHGWGKIVLHTSFDLSILVRTYAHYSDHVRSSHNVIFCTFERSYSSVLHPILVKLHILTRLIKSFPMANGSWSCIETEMLIM